MQKRRRLCKKKPCKSEAPLEIYLSFKSVAVHKYFRAKVTLVQKSRRQKLSNRANVTLHAKVYPLANVSSCKSDPSCKSDTHLVT